MSVTISVSHDFEDLRRKIANLRTDQLPYATARALTATANAAKAEMPAFFERFLSRPKSFTKSGVFVTAARKTDQRATIGLKDIQARYLAPLLAGQTRQQKPSEQKFLGRYFVPARVLAKDQYGNVSKNTLLAILKAAQEKSAWRGRRVVVVTSDAGPVPAGVYSGARISGRGRNEGLSPLLLFVKSAPKYRRQLDFKGEVERVARARFADEFRAAYSAAIATAAG